MIDTDGDALVSLVAERDGVVVGHVLFSRMDVEADGAAPSGAGLAPVSVAPASQGQGIGDATDIGRSEEHTSELQSLMRISYAVFCLKKKTNTINKQYMQ